MLDTAPRPEPARTLSYATYRGRRRVDVLDGIRAVSVLLVFTSHPAYPSVWPGFHGSAGVTIFFVLSGYLITTLAVREESETGRLDLRAFYIRRAFRIYPLFLGVLALYAILILVLGVQSERRDVFLQNVPYFLLGFPEHSILDPSVEVPFSLAWSLGLEEKFYLVWPVVGFGLFAAAVRRRIGFLLLVALLATTFGVEHGRVIAGYAHIAFGCILALLLHQRRWYERLRILGTPAALSAMGVLFVVLQFGTAAILKPTQLYVPYGILITALLCGIVTTASGIVGWLRSRPMVFLGRISYAFYLLHGFGLKGAEMLVPGGWGFPGSALSSAIGLAAAIVIAWVAHLLVERPAVRLGQRFSTRLGCRRAKHRLRQARLS